jgi:hypothetical protein
VTTNFMALLCEMNLRGLRVLKSLRILTKERSMSAKTTSITEAITIKKSSYDQDSLR